MFDELPSVTAVVSLFPAPSQTFIVRKLRGLHAAGVPVSVAATSFGPTTGADDYPRLSLMPWRSARIAVQRPSLPAWRATLGSLNSEGGRGVSGLRERVTTAPLRAVDTDIVHFEFSGIAVSYLDVLPALHDRARIAVSCRGAAEQIEPLKDPARAEALMRVFEVADLIHCVSDDMRRIVEDLGAPAERILVNRPAVPVADFAPMRARATDHDGGMRVLSIGRLHWKKGLDDGVRAIAALAGRGVDVEYRIAGEGPEREKLSFLVEQLGVGDRVTLTGLRTEAQIRTLLSWADVLLLPSLSEGISNAALEAMAAGLPVVSTVCGGMREVIDPGRNGILVDIGDTAAMADHLALLAGDPTRRAELGVAAAATADAQLDISHQVRRFVAAYERMVER